VWLNPDGFPQDNGALAPNWNSDLSTKPTCQYEASFKISQGFLSQWPSQLWQAAPLPYKSAVRPQDWLLAHLQIYIYYHYLLNLSMDKVLANLEQNGLLDNTIIIFTSDHGEMGGAHGGQIEKWHNAYRESIHVPLMVSSPLVNPEPDQIRDIDLVTSHIWPPLFWDWRATTSQNNRCFNLLFSAMRSTSYPVATSAWRSRERRPHSVPMIGQVFYL
jgi:hypothetical protein